jgi:Spy/CpxP family protein refolding chaperone
MFMTKSLIRLAIAGALATKQLALTTTQKQQAKDLFKQVKTTNQPVRTELKQNRQALTAAIKSNNVAQIDQLTQAQANLKAKTMTARSEAMAKFYASLTPDQKTKADQIQVRMEKRAAKVKG